METYTRSQQKTPFDSIGITNDLMFKWVFGRSPELARELVEAATGRRVEAVDVLEAGHDMNSAPDARGIQVDVYLRDLEGNMYAAEMQWRHEPAVALRVRFYQSELDRDAILRGEPFERLHDSIVVFISKYDPFKHGYRKYTLRTHCVETGAYIDDGRLAVILCASGTKGDAGERMNKFLRYTRGDRQSDVMEDDFVRQVDERVQFTRLDPQWRRELMLQEERERRARSEGERRGYLRGEEEGFKKGEEEGFKKGSEEGFQRGSAEGFQRGSEEGFERGSAEGFQRGSEEGFERGSAEGFQRGSEEGFERGSAEGFQRGSEEARVGTLSAVSELHTALQTHDRLEEFEAAVSNPQLFEALLNEFGIQ